MRPARAAAAVAAAGFAAVGLTAAGFLDGGSEPLRALTVLFGLVVVPGVLVARRVARSPDLPGPLAAYPLGILLVLSAHAVVAEAAARLGLALSVYTDVVTWTLLAGYAATAAWHSRGRRVADRRLSMRRILVAAAAVGVLSATALAIRPTLGPREDALDHIGYIRRAMVHDSLRPDGVLAWPDDATRPVARDPRKGSLHAMLAAAASLARIDPATLWVLLPVILLPVAVLAFAGFCRAFVGGGLPLAGCLALFALSYDGTGLQFIPTVAYGQNLAATWYWMITPLALAGARAGMGRARALQLVLLCVGGVFVHLGVGLHVAVLAGTLVVTGGWIGLPRAGRSVAAAVLAVASAAAVAMRMASSGGTANVIHAHLQGVLFLGSHWVVASPMEILREHGMVFLGGLALLPVTGIAARTDARARAVLAFSLVPAGAAFLPFIATPLFARASYMVFRILLNAPIMAVVVLTTTWMLPAARRSRRVVRFAAAVAISVWGIVFLSPALGAFRADARRALARPAGMDPGTRALVQWARTLPPGSTILSDPATSYLLSAYTAHRFVALFEQHANPYDPYALDRLRTVRDATSPYAVQDVAIAACRRYHADYLVLSRSTGSGTGGFLSSWASSLYDPARERIRSMPEFFQPVFEHADAAGFRVRTGGVMERRWSGLPPPVTVESPPVEPCDPAVPGDAFRITGVSVSPGKVLPGDVVTVTLRYRRDADVECGFPLVVHLRFDHASIPSAPRYPGEKQVRRARERWTGSFGRFRADVRPGHGVYDPDLWPAGMDLCERFTVAVPSSTRLGNYRVEVGVERESVLPNFHLGDLLYDRDHYSGVPCATLTVASRVVAGEER